MAQLVPERPATFETFPVPSEAPNDAELSKVLVGCQRVALLKKIDELSGQAFREQLNLSEGLGPKIERVVFHSDMSVVSEGSEEFFQCLFHKCSRMESTRRWVLAALRPGSPVDHGFDDFERTLILGSAKISSAYDNYWVQWMRAVQDSAVCTALDAMSEEEKAAVPHLFSPYTIVRVDPPQGAKGVTTEPYAVFFAGILKPVLSAMDECVAALGSVGAAASDTVQRERQAMIAFLTSYRGALSETSAETLEQRWAEVDRCWMDVKGPIQIVHDIEDGYSDPLRAKQGPDFSLRFLDETYAKQNEIIRQIQGVIVEYYKGRDTPLTRHGLTALANTQAGIYYIPFKTGCSLVFSYSGQSIPNRLDVKLEKGVKIYFDAVETQARVELVKARAREVFADGPALVDKWKPDAVEQLVWHVAAHEVGHAIYGMSNMASHMSSASITELEEPRAELTAMHTIKLLKDNGMLDGPHSEEALVHFLLDGLRYFAKFHSQPMQPYIIFQIHAYKTYEKHGMLTTGPDGRLVLDATKTDDVLRDFSARFESVLDALDRGGKEGAAALEAILSDLRAVTPFVQHVVDKCLA